jgi:hypothetical protein
MAHGLEFAGIGVDLVSIQCHMTQAHQPWLLAQPKYFSNEPGQDIEMTPTENAVPAGVWLLVARQNPEGGVRLSDLLDLPGTEQPDALALQELQHRHSRVLGFFSARILLAAVGVYLLKIERSSQIQQEQH